MKRLTVWLTVFFFLASAYLFAQVPQELYLKNRLYTGKLITVNKLLYVPLKSFLRAMGLGWMQKDGAVELFPAQDFQGDLSVNQSRLNFLFQDKLFSLPVYLSNNLAFIPVKQMAESLGAVYSENPDTEIADVSFIIKESAPTVPAPASAASSAPGQGGAETGKPEVKEEDKNPVKVADFDYYWNQPVINAGQPATLAQDSEFRGTAVIKNTSEKKIDNIKLILHFKDGYGQDMDKIEESSFSLGPGESRKFSWFWINPTRVNANPKIEIKLPENK